MLKVFSIVYGICNSRVSALTLTESFLLWCDVREPAFSLTLGLFVFVTLMADSSLIVAVGFPITFSLMPFKCVILSSYL